MCLIIFTLHAHSRSLFLSPFSLLLSLSLSYSDFFHRTNVSAIRFDFVSSASSFLVFLSVSFRDRPSRNSGRRTDRDRFSPPLFARVLPLQSLYTVSLSRVRGPRADKSLASVSQQRDAGINGLLSFLSLIIYCLSVLKSRFPLWFYGMRII